MVLHNGPVIRAPAFYNNGSRYLSRIDQGVNLLDDQFLELGTDQDTVIVHRSTINNANTGITGVLVGTPVTPIIPANSTIISNITASGDILLDRLFHRCNGLSTGYHDQHHNRKRNYLSSS